MLYFFLCAFGFCCGWFAPGWMIKDWLLQRRWNRLRDEAGLPRQNWKQARAAGKAAEG